MTERTAVLYLSKEAASSIQTVLRQQFAEAAKTQAHGYILDIIAAYALKQEQAEILESLGAFADQGGDIHVYQEGLETMEAKMEFWPNDTPDPSFDHLVTLNIPQGSVLG